MMKRTNEQSIRFHSTGNSRGQKKTRREEKVIAIRGSFQNKLSRDKNILGRRIRNWEKEIVWKLGVETWSFFLFFSMVAGKPTPTVSWYRDDKLVSNKTVTVRNGVARNELVIKNLGRNDVRSTLTCNATNNNRSIPLSTTVYVDMNCEYYDR